MAPVKGQSRQCHLKDEQLVGPQTQEKAIGRKKEVNSHTLKTIGMSVNKLGTRIAS